MTDLLARFEHNNVFSDAEGWALFKAAAITEACGWTMLITGIGLSRYVLHGNQVPILIAGRFHGMFFCLYLLAVVGLYPAMRWSRPRTLVALLAGVLPYSSLLFELWVGHDRKSRQFHVCRSCVVFNLLASKGDALSPIAL